MCMKCFCDLFPFFFTIRSLKFFTFRLLMKLIFRMTRKMICLMIAQKTMASQVIRVILIQHPQKDHFLRNLKNRRKMKRWTKRCKCYRKATIRSRRIPLIYFVSTLQMKSDHWIKISLKIKLQILSSHSHFINVWTQQPHNVLSTLLDIYTTLRRRTDVYYDVETT